MEDIKKTETTTTEETPKKDGEQVEEKKDTQENKEVYNNNKAEEKSLEQEVMEAKDKKYLADQIVKTNEELSSLSANVDTILKILQGNNKSFTNSEVASQGNDKDNNKFMININR